MMMQLRKNQQQPALLKQPIRAYLLKKGETLLVYPQTLQELQAGLPAIMQILQQEAQHLHTEQEHRYQVELPEPIAEITLQVIMCRVLIADLHITVIRRQVVTAVQAQGDPIQKVLRSQLMLYHPPRGLQVEVAPATGVAKIVVQHQEAIVLDRVLPAKVQAAIRKEVVVIPLRQEVAAVVTPQALQEAVRATPVAVAVPDQVIPEVEEVAEVQVAEAVQAVTDANYSLIVLM